MDSIDKFVQRQMNKPRIYGVHMPLFKHLPGESVPGWYVRNKGNLATARTATQAVALDWDRVTVILPDGMEFAGNGTIQFGLTANAVFTTNAPTWDALITGFEY